MIKKQVQYLYNKDNALLSNIPYDNIKIYNIGDKQYSIVYLDNTANIIKEDGTYILPEFIDNITFYKNYFILHNEYKNAIYIPKTNFITEYSSSVKNYIDGYIYEYYDRKSKIYDNDILIKESDGYIEKYYDKYIIISDIPTDIINQDGDDEDYTYVYCSIYDSNNNLIISDIEYKKLDSMKALKKSSYDYTNNVLYNYDFSILYNGKYKLELPNVYSDKYNLFIVSDSNNQFLVDKDDNILFIIPFKATNLFKHYKYYIIKDNSSNVIVYDSNEKKIINYFNNCRLDYNKEANKANIFSDNTLYIIEEDEIYYKKVNKSHSSFYDDKNTGYIIDDHLLINGKLYNIPLSNKMYYENKLYQNKGLIHFDSNIINFNKINIYIKKTNSYKNIKIVNTQLSHNILCEKYIIKMKYVTNN